MLLMFTIVLVSFKKLSQDLIVFHDFLFVLGDNQTVSNFLLVS